MVQTEILASFSRDKIRFSRASKIQCTAHEHACLHHTAGQMHVHVLLYTQIPIKKNRRIIYELINRKLLINNYKDNRMCMS